MPDRRLAGRVAVVTGAGRGIGRAIALQMAAEGASVALAARSADALDATAGAIVAGGGRAIAVPTDLRVAGDVDRLLATVEHDLGPVDLLVSNSGIPGPTKVLWETEPAEWTAALEVNLIGTYLCCRAFLPGMVARRQGSVVVIGSATGKRPLHGRTAYAASKLGLVGLVRSLAWETGRHDIRVNLISPGPTDGDRMRNVIRGQSESRGLSLEEAREEFTGATALARFVDPAHVAEAAVFLASDAAASITGEDLNVSAGMAMF